MDPGDLRLFEAVGTESTFSEGQVLIEHGRPGTGLYVILDGTVVVDAPEGTRQMGAGACVGDRALFAADGLRTARVRAATDVRVLAVDRSDFEQLCADDPGLAGRVAEAAS
jgi:CRP-like cAMP-binding protein